MGRNSTTVLETHNGAVRVLGLDRAAPAVWFGGADRKIGASFYRVGH